MPKIVDASEQRRAIRSAARAVFARRGVSTTGLGHVAEAAGMGRSSLYHYYPDKRSLVRDLLRDLLASEEELFRAAMRRPAPPLERIESLLAALTRSFDEWRTAGRVLLELRARELPRFRGFFRRIRGHLAKVVAEGQKSGEIDATLDPQSTAALLIGAVDGLLLQYLVEPDGLGDPGALRDSLVTAARKMLRP